MSANISQKTFKNGEVYIGPQINKKKHGLGQLITTHGNKLQGEWLNDKLNGIGMELTACEKYIGEFRNGLRNGLGISTMKGTQMANCWLTRAMTN